MLSLFVIFGAILGTTLAAKVTDMICSDHDLTSLCAAIKATDLKYDLDNIFSQTSQFTIFAPVNDAFKDIDLDNIDLKDLRDILLYHVIPRVLVIPDDLILFGLSTPKTGVSIESLLNKKRVRVFQLNGINFARDRADNNVRIARIKVAKDGEIYKIGKILDPDLPFSDNDFKFSGKRKNFGPPRDFFNKFGHGFRME
mmetsp:Transcript_1434/g.1940  ORF Transcript_1434/g.1940 Transcript_1434/m.1940 type:complete len:198 (+) Transcript_1434:101-694(+)